MRGNDGSKDYFCFIKHLGFWASMDSVFNGMLCWRVGIWKFRYSRIMSAVLNLIEAEALLCYNLNFRNGWGGGVENGKDFFSPVKLARCINQKVVGPIWLYGSVIWTICLCPRGRELASLIPRTAPHCSPPSARPGRDDAVQSPLLLSVWLSLRILEVFVFFSFSSDFVCSLVFFLWGRNNGFLYENYDK